MDITEVVILDSKTTDSGLVYGPYVSVSVLLTEINGPFDNGIFYNISLSIHIGGAYISHVKKDKKTADSGSVEVYNYKL